MDTAENIIDQQKGLEESIGTKSLEGLSESSPSQIQEKSDLTPLERKYNKGCVKIESNVLIATASEEVAEITSQNLDAINSTVTAPTLTIMGETPQLEMESDRKSVNFESNILIATASEEVAEIISRNSDVIDSAVTAPTLTKIGETPQLEMESDRSSVNIESNVLIATASEEVAEIISRNSYAINSTVTAPTLTKMGETPQLEMESDRNSVNIESNVLIGTASEEVAEIISQNSNAINFAVTAPTDVINSVCIKSGLSLIAQYASSDDERESSAMVDSDVEVVPLILNSTEQYRNKVIEIEETSSESGSDVEYLSKISKVINRRQHEFDDDDDDDDLESCRSKSRQQPRVKGEMLLDDLPLIQDLQITVPAEECIELGKVHSIVGQLVLVTVRPNSILLDLETVLFLECGRKVLGEVFDVLGQVADPMYCVRFNTQKQIEDRGISVGDLVYVAPKTEYTQFVILSSLMKFRGSDASWENDIEPPSRYLDYSDDEQERAARVRSRNKTNSSDCDNQKKRGNGRSNDYDMERETPSTSTQQRRKQFRQSNLSSPPQHINNNNDNSWHSNIQRQSHGSNFIPPNYTILNQPPPVNYYPYMNQHPPMFPQLSYPQQFNPHAPPPSLTPHYSQQMPPTNPTYPYSTPPPPFS